MDIIQEKAYAKLNLTLGVRGKRADGYHELDMLMQTVDLYDTVSVKKDRDITVLSTGMLLPYDNTLRRAAEYYKKLTGRGAFIQVQKRIPAQAGLGGGSADAAAVLRALDRLYGEVDRGTLKEIALKVGADVPFCLQGGLCRAEGIGEILTPIKAMKLYAVVTKPEKGVSTKMLYQSLVLPLKLPDTGKAMQAISENNLENLASVMHNALQEPAEKQVPEISEHIERLEKEGAAVAQMTGSGSAVFGLFSTKEAALAAEKNLQDLPFCRFCETV